MSNFRRALWLAKPYWYLIALAVGCSVGVAATWGANIAALWPILEVTLKGDSLQNWNRQRIAYSETTIERYEARLKEIAGEIARAPAPKKLEQESADLQTQLQRERLTRDSLAAMQPRFEAWLPSDPFQTVLLVVGFVVLGTAVKQLLMVANAMLVGCVSFSIARSMRQQIFEKSLGMDRAGFLQLGASGFTSHITYTTDMLAAGIMNVYGGAVTEPLKIFACLFGAWCISWQLLTSSLLVAPIACVLIVWINRKMKQTSRKVLAETQGMHHVMLEAFGAMLSVQAYTMEEQERRRFRDAANAMYQGGMKVTFYNALVSPVTEVLGIGMVSTAIAAGAYLVIHQQTHLFGIPMSSRPLGISQILVFYGLLIGASDPVRKLSSVISAINTGGVAANALFPLLDRESLIQEPASPKTIGAPHREIEFRNMAFAYRPNETILRNVNIKIPFGERVAIVGPNGGGKSTLMNVLCRFYDPQEGAVLVDGVDVRELSLRDLRGRVGLVTQHTELFNESILYNIRYGRWDATDEEVVEAAKKAFAHDFIMTFPEGYQTVVASGGQRLSGGQRQRIALARAILRDPEILILDEATSQIDVDSELLIHNALVEFSRNRTVLMVTHRQSTLELADAIIEIRDGTATKRRKERRAAA